MDFKIKKFCFYLLKKKIDEEEHKGKSSLKSMDLISYQTGDTKKGN